MSHEIRTPINAVLGMNEMVLRHSNEPEVIGYARDVDTAAKSLLQIVNDILDIIRLETGSIEIVSEEYDLEQLFRSVKSMALVKAQKKNLSIVFDFDNQLPKRLRGDFVRVKQIIMNLASNAIKYTNEGSVTISIHGSVLTGRVELQVAVEDTGIGIKAEDIPKLKEKFQRIEETKNRSVEGVGLGLSIASQLLYMMESDLKIESEFGKGSRFSFKLWQDVVDSTAVCDSALPVRNIKRSECSFKAPSAQILAVDDNEMNLKVTSKLLEPALMQIDTAKSGAEALILADEKRYDIILMDHMMPEMDGIETFKRIKENSEFNKATPVIVLTANAILGAREQYLKAGFSDYLSKPVIPKELEDMIKKYLPDNKIES